ncbi:RNA-guided endonuclease InsQ/TnpB family protein [Sabulicella rubraurantiaca]|uniref:RNA-guided endonuclease InsQ/TnpB family protein n=1 Tax=Sabulicella rubraurantiaca TaxID=2811429 RepID=UPI001A97014A|nr:transposase [Sabulicella rubraurantiaca]
MKAVSILRPKQISPGLQATLRDSQKEAGRLWTDIVALHRRARAERRNWPSRSELQVATKGRYRLHSQTVQMICHQLLANVEATATRRQNDPRSREWLRFPHKEKRFFPLYWPAQAVSYDAASRRLVLPMGRGRKSLVFKLDLNFTPGSVKLVWNEGHELHIVRSDVAQTEETPGTERATIDLGEIHLGAVATSTGKALVVSGRGIRSHKRLLSKQLSEIARRRSRCKKGSRQSLKLQKARQKRSLLTSRRVRDLRHKATTRIIRFCAEAGVGEIFIGDPRGVRDKDVGRKQNGRMARWEMGTDMSYIAHKAKRLRMACFTGDERGTSSQCPQCDHRQKVRGRVWRCRSCSFEGARDVVGAVNMHPLAFEEAVMFPVEITYRRPGRMGGRGMNTPVLARSRALERRSRPDTGLREAERPLAPQLLETAPPPGGTRDRSQAPGNSAPLRSTGRRKTQPRAA